VPRYHERMNSHRLRVTGAFFPLALACACAGAATLAGRLTYPGDSVPAMTVIARDAGAENVFAVHTTRGQSSYRLAVRPGAYIVFAVPDAAADPRLRGAYTAYSLCAHDRARVQGGRCRTGPLVVVKVAEGDAKTGIDVDDWNLPEEIAATLRWPVGKAAVTPAMTTLPRYDAFPATAAAPAAWPAPDYDSAPPATRPFRARLEAAVASGPYFAGTVALARWGCGSGCENWALIDRETGTVTMPERPLQPLNNDLPCEHELLEFRPDSRLLLVHQVDGARVVTHALVWQNETHGLSQVAQIVTPVVEFCARAR
jgi:hypothetical protein